MTSHEFDTPASPQERLDTAKAAFRNTVLQNDALFSVVKGRLDELDEREKLNNEKAELPDFGLEPTLQRRDDGTSIIGLRINRSATVASAMDGVTSVYVGVYDYFPLGQMDCATGETKVTPELETAITKAGMGKADAPSVLQMWQAGVREMDTQFPQPLVLDPMTSTFVL